MTVQRGVASFFGLIVAAAIETALSASGDAAVFQCPSGDATCLVTAITTANANGEVNTIRLDAGTYTLRAVDNDTDGPNGLPSVTSPLTVIGAGQDSTVIQRDASASPFRLIHVGPTGVARLDALTLRGGQIRDGEGGSVLSRGVLMINQSTITSNSGGGISSFGTVVIAQSTLSANRAGLTNGHAGLSSSGTATVINSMIVDNNSGGAAAGVFSSGSLTVFNSTIARNIGSTGGGVLVIGGNATILNSTIANNYDDANGGGVSSLGGAVTITSSTIAHNVAPSSVGQGIYVDSGMMTIRGSTIAYNHGPSPALSNRGGVVILQNSIVAENRGGDCGGAITSLDNNLIGDPTGCTMTLLPSDLTGDPGLDTFTDDGTPGHGYVPLVSTSPALDAANDAACLPTDQLGQSRPDPCDIGAIEFQAATPQPIATSATGRRRP